jgi:hypothetical protein
MKCKAGSGSWRRRSPLELLKCPGLVSRKAANRAVIMGQLNWRLLGWEYAPGFFGQKIFIPLVAEGLPPPF